MKRAAAGLLLLVLAGCAPRRDETPAAPPLDPEAEAAALLHRLHDEARARARPDRASLARLVRLELVPSRDSPPVRTLAREETPGGLRLETLEFESEPGVPVPATLWLPEAPRRCPAVVVTHGHLEGGRFAPAVRERCAALARAGIAALAIDLFGHGERAPLGHREDFQLYAAGDSMLGLDVRSLLRALDLLAARGDVDPTRLGLLGQSGGAIAALHAAALDERVAATFACSGLHDWENALLTVPQCPCNFAPRQLELGTVADAATLVPPRALFVSGGRADPTIPEAGARAAFARVADAASAAGAPQSARLEMREGEGHEFTSSARRSALAFFTERFGLAEPAERGDAAAGSGLREAWPSGPPEDALSLAALAALRQRARRPAVPLSADELRAGLRSVLALPAPAPPAVDRGDGRLVLETEPGLHLVGRLVGGDGELVLLLDSRGGRAALEDRTHDPGARVLAVDLRGQGESAGGAWDYLQLQVGCAAGAPLLGRRVHDVRGWLATARLLAGDGPLRVRASGESAFVVLLLAGLQPELFAGAEIELSDLPATLLAEPGGDSAWGLPQSLAVAGLAELGDVPELAALLPAELRGRVEATRLRGRDGRPLAEASAAAARLLPLLGEAAR